MLSLMLAHPPARADEGIEITQAHLESTDEGYKLSATFAFDLNRGLEDAITRGVPLYFTTTVELHRPRWYWFDEKTVSTSQTIRIDYNVLTRRYRAGVLGSVQQSFGTLDDALSLIRRPSRWIVADRKKLKAGQKYDVEVRMQLNLEFLPKPFQIHALNSSHWRLSSDWKFFTFKAE
ncbi:MAG TPA: DUF4390 domain-containing protein [Burkholderiaceae bacterium]|jgi:hypothetical protein|nr:DUF4390 domain-containing protein [Burkholderiaceae bacterium]